MGITLIYAAHMDKDDLGASIRMQAVPTFAETHRSDADMIDPLHEDEDSPVRINSPLIRQSIVLNNCQCSMYCRHYKKKVCRTER